MRKFEILVVQSSIVVTQKKGEERQKRVLHMQI